MHFSLIYFPGESETGNDKKKKTFPLKQKNIIDVVKQESNTETALMFFYFANHDFSRKKISPFIPFVHKKVMHD